MHSAVANDSPGSTHNEVDGRVDTPAGILHHASRFFLSLVSDTGDRSILPPASIAGFEDRSALAQLIAFVAPDDAVILSKALLTEFGSIGRIFCESEESLWRIVGEHSGVTELLTATKKVLSAQLQADLPKMLISATDQKLIRYLQAGMGSLATETMRVLFLDNAHQMIREQEFGLGSFRKIFVPPRLILKRALELNASGIILVHNHPNGSAKPSKTDVKFTQCIRMLCIELEIVLHDHIIIAGSDWSSLRELKAI